MFSGSLCALVTPFRDHQVDEAALQKLIEWQLVQGTDGLVPCGTTGESSTLSYQEHKRVVEICVQVVAKRRPVIAGAGSNSTDEAIALARHAQQVGADAVLVVAPYYNKPTQQGIYQHYLAIHQATDLPIIVYNIPGRCLVDIEPSTMCQLAALPRIVGVKDATQDLSRPLTTRCQIGADFCQLSGEDATVIAFLAQGGVGCISVTANVAPKWCAQLHQNWRQRNWDRVEQLRDRLMPLHKILFIESSPAPTKYALSLMRHCTAEVRLPLLPPSEPSKRLIEQTLQQLGLWSP